MADMYDIENALRELAKHRQRQDDLIVATLSVADDLALNIGRHFGPEGAEVAGLALVICAASIGVLKDLPPVVVVNTVAFAGQRLVLDARAADTAVRNG